MQAEFSAFWAAHGATPLAARDVLLRSACPQAIAATPTSHHPPLTLSLTLALALTLSLTLALALTPSPTLALALTLSSYAACTW